MSKTPPGLLATAPQIIIAQSRSDSFVELRNVLHVTPEAATALVQIEQMKKEATIARSNADIEASKAAIVQANMNKEIALAEVDKAKETFAVPAQEATKRSKQVSYRLYTATTFAIVVAILALKAGLKEGHLVTVLLGVAALVGAERTVTNVLANAKSKKELPPKSGAE